MARGDAVERATKVPECDFGRTVKSESSDTYMRPRIVKSSSKKEPDRFQNLNRDSEDNFAHHGDVLAHNRGNLLEDEGGNPSRLLE
jgi:hypothetical protein